jgi:glucokinase
MPTRRIIGVDIGGTRLLAGAVDASLAVHHRTRRAISGYEQPILLDAAVDAIDETRDAAGAEVAAVGFAIRSSAGQGSDAGEQQAAQGAARIGHLMAERIGLPAFADTAANVVALAEHRAGAARGARNAVVLTIDTGIEAGVIIGGALERGLAAPGIAQDGGAQFADAARLTELAHDGDGAAADALARLGGLLGAVIAEFVRSYAPQVVVVGGDVTAAGELLLGPARSALAAHGAAPAGDAVPIVTARFGADAGIAGAAALAFDELERRAA